MSSPAPDRTKIPGLFKASTEMLISESIPQLIEADAIKIPSVLVFHVAAVPKKMLLKALWYADHQANARQDLQDQGQGSPLRVLHPQEGPQDRLQQGHRQALLDVPHSRR
jgi:hypothetical protein